MRVVFEYSAVALITDVEVSERVECDTDREVQRGGACGCSNASGCKVTGVALADDDIRRLTRARRRSTRGKWVAVFEHAAIGSIGYINVSGAIDRHTTRL